MYKQLWQKYVPIVRLLMKRSDAEPQTLELNRLDFDGAGVKKSNLKFTIEFQNGKVSNIIHDSRIAMDLSDLLLENEQVNDILSEQDVVISVNTKYQMTIKPLS